MRELISWRNSEVTLFTLCCPLRKEINPVNPTAAKISTTNGTINRARSESFLGFRIDLHWIMRLIFWVDWLGDPSITCWFQPVQ